MRACQTMRGIPNLVVTMPRPAPVPARVCALLFLACAAHQSLAAAAGSSSAELASGTLALSLVPTDTADRYGAKCIDGTPPALYISRNESSTQWVRLAVSGRAVVVASGVAT